MIKVRWSTLKTYHNHIVYLTLLVGGSNPSENMKVSWDDSSCSKPPTSKNHKNSIPIFQRNPPSPAATLGSAAFCSSSSKARSSRCSVARVSAVEPNEVVLGGWNLWILRWLIYPSNGEPLVNWVNLWLIYGKSMVNQWWIYALYMISV